METKTMPNIYDASFAICFDKPWKNWLFYCSVIGCIISLSVGYCIIESKDNNRRFKFITPYGTQIFKQGDGRPYIKYDVSFYKGDTLILIRDKQEYKVIEIK